MLYYKMEGAAPQDDGQMPEEEEMPEDAASAKSGAKKLMALKNKINTTSGVTQTDRRELIARWTDVVQQFAPAMLTKQYGGYRKKRSTKRKSTRRKSTKRRKKTKRRRR
jgi:hypothetical protein